MILTFPNFVKESATKIIPQNHVKQIEMQVEFYTFEISLQRTLSWDGWMTPQTGAKIYMSNKLIKNSLAKAKEIQMIEQDNKQIKVLLTHKKNLFYSSTM